MKKRSIKRKMSAAVAMMLVLGMAAGLCACGSSGTESADNIVWDEAADVAAADDAAPAADAEDNNVGSNAADSASDADDVDIDSILGAAGAADTDIKSAIASAGTLSDMSSDADSNLSDEDAIKAMAEAMIGGM